MFISTKSVCCVWARARPWDHQLTNGELVDVRKEHGEERAAVSELRASVDAKVLAAVTEALVQVADACTCVHCMLCLGEGE